MINIIKNKLKFSKIFNKKYNLNLYIGDIIYILILYNFCVIQKTK